MATRLLASGSEFQVNVDGGSGDGLLGNQSQPQAAALTDGRFAVAYQNPFQGNNSDLDVIANVLGSTSFLVPYSFTQNQTEPVIAPRPGGAYGIVFTNALHATGAPDANGPNITYVPVSATGVTGTPLAVADFDFGGGIDGLTNPDIATLSDGRQVVVFERTFDANDHDIRLNVVNAAGTAPQFAANLQLPVDIGSDFQGNPSVAASGNQALVVYEDSTDTTIGSRNIRSKLFDGGSNTVGAGILIADHSAALSTPSVAALADNRYVIVYTDNVDIFARIYDPVTPGGAFLSAEFRIDQPGGNTAIEPSVFGTIDGGFIVTWTEDDGGSSGYDIRARRFDAHGLAFGDEFLVNTFTDSGQAHSTVATSGANVLIAWDDFGSRPGDTTPLGIRAKQFTTTAFDYDSAGLGDLNADGRADILFQNDTGNVMVWQTNGGGAVNAITDLGQRPAGFKVFGTGNFNGTPGDDILLRSDAGSLAIWPTNGIAVGAHIVIGSTSPDYHNAGIGDFTGDGQEDLLFRNDLGEIVTWGVANNGLAIAPQILGSAPAVYQIVGIDDLTGDRQADILFRHLTGDIALWQVANNGLAGVPKVIGSTSPSYHIVGTGDFDGNGAKDILFRGDNGDLVEWLLDSTGSLLSAPTAIGNATSNYHVDGTGDLNGDGRDDIIFRDADGTLIAWFMNGTTFAAPPAVLGKADVDYAIAAHHFDVV